MSRVPFKEIMPGGRNPSSAVISSWPSPNFTASATTQGPCLSIMTWAFIALVPVIVGARIYARWWVIRKPGLDDYVFLCAIPPIMAFNICVLLMEQNYYFGHHIWDVPHPLFVAATEVNWFGEVFVHVGSTALKISILLFYRRLTAAGHSLLWLWIVRTAIAFVALWGLAFLVVNLMACTPLEAYWLTASWTPYTGQYTCLREEIYWPLNGAMSVLTDIISVLIPCCMVANLKTTMRQKRLLYALFSLGFLTAIAGAIRLTYTVRVLWYTYDIFWEGYPLILATIIELNFGVLLASAPALKPLFSKSLPPGTPRTTPKEMPQMSEISQSSKIITVGMKSPMDLNINYAGSTWVDKDASLAELATSPRRDDLPVRQYAHSRDISATSVPLVSAIRSGPYITMVDHTISRYSPRSHHPPASPAKSVHFNISDQPSSSRPITPNTEITARVQQHLRSKSNLSAMTAATQASGVSSLTNPLSPVPSIMNVSLISPPRHSQRLDEPLPPLPLETRHSRGPSAESGATWAAH